MKAILLIFFTLVHSIVTKSQDYRRNENWVTGFAPVVKLNYQNSLLIDTFIYKTYTKCSSNISDTNGIFLFYSTGYSIMDKYSDTMLNGNYVNCPQGNVLADYYGLSSLFDQTSIILPKKGNTYYVFSTGMSDSFANNYINQINGAFWDVLNYSVVDMDSNGGKGKVVLKNIVLSDSQKYANTAMHAVKHANGKDWWLVKADCYNNRYQEYLVKEDTILGPYYQQATDSLSNAFCIGGLNQIYFSDDGKQMASGIYGTVKNGPFYFRNRVDLYAFNRCDGSLTYKNHYEVPQDTSTYVNYDVKKGLCFSPNGKLLYMSNKYTIYQIDLEDTNKFNATFIHGPDTSNLSYFPLFSTMAVAPDGKLYIGNQNGIRKYMSYIDKPNVKGLGCNFVAQGVWQPYTNLMSPPNMPNYGLGEDTSVVCWPLGLPSPPKEVVGELVVYPNPASSKLVVRYEILDVSALEDKRNAKIELYNTLGQLMYSSPISHLKSPISIDVSNLSIGVYYLRVENQVVKVVVE